MAQGGGGGWEREGEAREGRKRGEKGWRQMVAGRVCGREKERVPKKGVNECLESWAAPGNEAVFQNFSASVSRRVCSNDSFWPADVNLTAENTIKAQL